MRTLIRWLLHALAVIGTAYFVPGVVITGFVPALLVGLVLGIFNIIVRPILILLTLPITIITLGLFILIINCVMVMLMSALVPGFAVSGLWPAFLFGIVMAIFNFIIDKLTKKKD
jgi:putative membrane protein